MSNVIRGKVLCSRIAAAFVAILLVAGPTRAETKKFPVLHIGTTETIVEEDAPEDSDDTAVEATYRQFIQAETGFDSDVVAVENHEVLAERLASGKLQLGFFMGYEFAWAQARHPQLKVLAVGINKYAVLVGVASCLPRARTERRWRAALNLYAEREQAKETGSKGATARLGMKRSTLFKMQKFGIRRPTSASPVAPAPPGWRFPSGATYPFHGSSQLARSAILDSPISYGTKRRSGRHRHGPCF